MTPLHQLCRGSALGGDAAGPISVMRLVVAAWRLLKRNMGSSNVKSSGAASAAARRCLGLQDVTS